MRGTCYPILLMDWVEGVTLDQYVQSDAASADAFRALAARWCTLISELETAGLAHGDLQHGNIIVGHGELRLVDYDGIFVPALQGMPSTELGHPAYQHPKRSLTDFNAKLDRFSSISIYVSLAALAAHPAFKNQCTGENLLFTRQDYSDPAKSEIFRELRKRGLPNAPILEAFQKACTGPPSATPRLLDLVSAPKVSQLPSWMQPVESIPEPTKIVIQPPRHVAGAPAAPAKPTYVPVSGTAPVVVTPTAPPLPRPRVRFSQLIDGAFSFAFFGALIALFIGASLSAILIAAGVGLLLAVYINYQEHRKRVRLSPLASSPSQSPAWPQPSYPPWNPSRTGHGGEVIASSIRTIYHRPSCEWVYKMSRRNQLRFANGGAAQAAGYRPCRVCRP